MKRVLVLFAAMAAACSQSSEQPPSNQSAAAETNQAAADTASSQAAVPSLEGEWVVDQLNGNPPDQTWPMTAEATKDHLTITSECHRFSYVMEQKGNLVTFKQSPDVGCGRFRSPAEFVAEKAIKLGNIAMFTDEGRTVQISGPGGSVTMSRR